MSSMIMFWIVFWSVIGTFVGLGNWDNWANMDISKKQTIFLYIVLGPVAWAVGIIYLIVLSFQLAWKLLE